MTNTTAPVESPPVPDEPWTQLHIGSYYVELESRDGALVWVVSHYHHFKTSTGRAKAGYPSERRIDYLTPWSHLAAAWAVAAMNDDGDGSAAAIFKHLTNGIEMPASLGTPYYPHDGRPVDWR
jgi:hypothetical protein